jgi:hypothetical protein
MNQQPHRHRSLLAILAAGVAAIMAACSTPPPAPTPQPQPEPKTPPVAVTPGAPTPTVKASTASTPRDYRRDAASHIYGQNANRIFKGKMPPLLYAIGVLQVELDGQGRVTKTSWMRAPSQAPEVISEIERTVRLAAPYPVPARMGRVTYTDTWLWHKSGQFQLDTLSEGQL